MPAFVPDAGDIILTVFDPTLAREVRTKLSALITI